MDAKPVFSLTNRWLVGSVCGTLAVAATAAAIGFVLLPSVQGGPQFRGIWNAICSAAGVSRHWAESESIVYPADGAVSAVTITPQTLAHDDPEAMRRGGVLAARCAACHNASQAVAPLLVGQDAAFVYKQLSDFQSGARTNVIMTQMVKGLSERDMRDLAHYFASSGHSTGGVATEVVPPIVARGNPIKNVVSCAVCHGGIDHKAGAPFLQGLSASYLGAQLHAFAAGQRHNDSGEQMRNIARNLTETEIKDAAAYYSGFTDSEGRISQP
ncbi:c-type cytochrome [Paraburkholderia azotifigens]|uniref:Cytochrome c4 n=1 Tax=Paraburkholderia azotifigens TaxID=2057004 RepID=A0A5C6V9Z6_9BURK|nr:c-type cytochrome [Paraburkholderia azotifigens]TXC81126.1 cytochrome c4 [Paraburkholderia azotifigens]